MLCVFVSGSIPDANLSRVAVLAAADMLERKDRSVRFVLGEDDAPSGEGGVTTRGEFVVLGAFGGIKCDIRVEHGPLAYSATILVKPGVSPVDLRRACLLLTPYRFFFPDNVPSVAEA